MTTLSRHRRTLAAGDHQISRGKWHFALPTTQIGVKEDGKIACAKTWFYRGFLSNTCTLEIFYSRAEKIAREFSSGNGMRCDARGKIGENGREEASTNP